MAPVTFPTFLFHKEHAPDGRIFHSAAAVPTEDGWVDTPAKFATDYVEPPTAAVADDSVPEDARRNGYVPAHYPAHLYHRETKDVVTVESFEAHAALELKFPGTYIDTPDADAYAQRRTRADAGDRDVTAPVPPTFSTAAVVTLSAEQQASFAKATIPQVIEQLEQISNPALIVALQAAEDGRANGPRVSVVKALKARLAELSVG